MILFRNSDADFCGVNPRSEAVTVADELFGVPASEAVTVSVELFGVPSATPTSEAVTVAEELFGVPASTSVLSPELKDESDCESGSNCNLWE